MKRLFLTSIFLLAPVSTTSGLLMAGTPQATDFILAGHDAHGCYSDQTCYDNPVIVRADQDGNVVWQVALPMAYWVDRGYIRPADRNITEDSFYLSTVYDSTTTGGLHRLLKYDRNGLLQWDRPIAATQMHVSANAVFGGAYTVSANTLYRVDTNGNVVWSKSFPNAVPWVTTDVATGGSHIIGGVQAATVSKLDALGNVVWTKDLSPHPAYQTVANPIDGGVYVGTDDYTHFTARLDRNGNVVWWLTDFPVAWPSGGTAYGRTVDPVSGDFFIGGWPGQYGRVTQAAGTPLWNVSTPTYNAYAAISLDGAHVFISGRAAVGIEKYNASNGSLVWRKQVGPSSWAGGFYDTAGIFIGAPGAATPPTPTIPGLIQNAQALGNVLNGGEVNSLVQKLNNAQTALDRGQTNAACGKLGAVVNEVEALVKSSRLTAVQAAPLLNGVAAVRATVPCGS